MAGEAKQIGFFEKYLTLWVLACIVAGIGLGKIAPGLSEVLGQLNVFGINLPVAILVWLMIYPMMVQIDFASLRNVRRSPRPLALTVIVNWLIKPFSMAFFAWLFFDNIFSAFLDPGRAAEYMAGAILLGAAPCTAMVFVWSYLSDGDPAYTLVQVAVNDLIILLAFVPIVGLLLGVTNVSIPYGTLFASLVLFVVIPLLAGYLSHGQLIRRKGRPWFEQVFLPKLKPVSILALLTTLVLLFAFQGEKILNNSLDIVLIAVPLSIQTYVIFALVWIAGRRLSIPYRQYAPAAMIGASNFFELAVAVAIALFGLNSGAALATVVGVLIEVPIMLSLVWFANRFNPLRDPSKAAASSVAG